MSPALDTREIGDIGDTVLSFSEAKALATNNPLLMDKAEADANLARLVRAERAHHRNQDTLRRTITRLEQHIATQTQLASDIDAAIARRQDTRGDAFTMTVEGRVYRKRVDAGLHLLHLLRQEAANQLGSRQRTLRAGELGGFPLTVTISRALGQVERDPGPRRRPRHRDDPHGQGTSPTPTRSAWSPGWRTGSPSSKRAKTKALAEIDHARSEIDHATASLGKPFPQAAELAAARERSRQIDEQLEAAAAPPQQDAEAADATAGQAGPRGIASHAVGRTAARSAACRPKAWPIASGGSMRATRSTLARHGRPRPSVRRDRPLPAATVRARPGSRQVSGSVALPCLSTGTVNSSAATPGRSPTAQARSEKQANRWVPGQPYPLALPHLI